MLLKDIWQELEHILGIATAIAPLVAVADPSTVVGVGSAEAMIALATPLVNQVVSSAVTPLTPADVTAQTQTVLNTALMIGQATGRVSAEKAAAIQALTPALIATVVAAGKPLP